MARCSWGFVLAALLVAVSCSSQTSAPAWRSFSSPEYGYSISYPPTWFALAAGGRPPGENYSRTGKNLGSPVEWERAELRVEVGPTCQSGSSRNEWLLSKWY